MEMDDVSYIFAVSYKAPSPHTFGTDHLDSHGARWVNSEGLYQRIDEITI